MNYGTESRQIFLRWIDDNKNVPVEYKSELKEIIASQFLIMSKTIATFELMILRENDNSENKQS